MKGCKPALLELLLLHCSCCKSRRTLSLSRSRHLALSKQEQQADRHSNIILLVLTCVREEIPRLICRNQINIKYFLKLLKNGTLSHTENNYSFFMFSVIYDMQTLKAHLACELHKRKIICDLRCLAL